MKVKIKSIELVQEIRKAKHELYQKDNTFMFIIEAPETGGHHQKLFKTLIEFGYYFDEERCVFEYDKNPNEPIIPE